MPNLYNPYRSFADGLRDVEPGFAGRSKAYGKLKEIVAKLDEGALKSIVDTYRIEINNDEPGFKYFDLVYWISEKIKIAEALNIDTHGPYNILDLGTGGGHWLAVCKAYDHDAQGIDINIPIYDQMAELMGVRRKICKISQKTRLPDFGKRFHVVTGFMVNFDSLPWGKGVPRSYYSREDWVFFLNDLVENHLQYPALIHFELNKQFDNTTQTYVQNPEVLRWFREFGFDMDRNGRYSSVTIDLDEPKLFT